METELRNKTKSALIWNSINLFGTMGFRLVITIILARILTPNDFGLIAMILVITSFSDLLINSGFKQGIIQQSKISNVELSSVFFLNIFVGMGCTLIVFAIAPLIGSFYENPELIHLTQVLSLVYVFKSFSVVQHGLMSREMDFKKRTISMMIAQVISGSVAIIAAVYGYGVWSLILNLLLNDFLMSVLLWIQTSWKPQWKFEFVALKNIWGFSSKILLMNTLATLGNKVDLFFIGKIFNAQILGLYSKGKDFAILPSSIGNQIITNSFFPVFAKLQNDILLFNTTYKRLYKLLVMVFTPLSAIMFICAEQIILLLLGEMWINSVPYFKWGSIMGLLYVINNLMNYVINSKGRSDLNLKRSLIHTPLRIGIFAVIPIFLNSFTPLYFIFIYIAFFISANIINNYFISLITNMSFSKIILLGGEYLLIVPVIVYLINSINLPLYVNNSFAELITISFLFSVSYISILAVFQDKTFFWALTKFTNQFSHVIRRN